MQITLPALRVMIIGGIPAVLVFIPQVFTVNRETLVQGQVAPAFTSHKVAEPLVEEFMRDNRLAFLSICHLAISLVDHKIPVECGTGILHSAADVVTHCDLGIFRPGVWHTK